MCTVCGCGEGETRLKGKTLGNDHHHHDHNHDHHHHHDHDHDHDHHNRDPGKQRLHYGKGPARAHAPGLDQGRMIEIEQDILSKNDQYARANRAAFAQQGIFALNLVSSPGSGKTTLLARTLSDLQNKFPLAVIEGDQETSRDAERIRATGAPAIQINTGKGCHLDAHMVGHAVESLAPERGAILFIENVGNLVCPAAFDLGEAHKVAILSITEGEDKPIKYPDMFHAADLLLLNKIDLLPYLQFDIEQCINYARQVNPSIGVLQLSATTGEGMDQWYRWLTLGQEQRQIGLNIAGA